MKNLCRTVESWLGARIEITPLGLAALAEAERGQSPRASGAVAQNPSRQLPLFGVSDHQTVGENATERMPAACLGVCTDRCRRWRVLESPTTTAVPACTPVPADAAAATTRTEKLRE